ncbi:spermatogenesis-associated protein 45 [Amia ocellicauda]|uniref:spermatogenesis-associated protein 45 n=1 Tax=Amia ocellicauda TaxID=2972642 RepID=UPI0034647222
MSNGQEKSLYDLNLHRETWCRVEASSKGSWLRSQRKHFPGHLQSSPDRNAPPAPGPEQRCSWVKGNANAPERRHFAQSYKAHLM